MKVLYLVFFILLLVNLSANSKSQEIIIKNAKGSCIITGNITFEQAKEKALNNAKLDALNKAGIETTVSSDVFYFETTSKDSLQDQLSSRIILNTKGNIINYSVKKEMNGINDLKNHFIEFIIDATVMKYETEYDPTFTAKIEGFDTIYKNGEPINFSIEPYQNMYLKIFYIGDDESSLLFPIEDVHDNVKLTKDKKYFSPFSNQLEYYEAFSEEKVSIGRIIIVLLKNDIPFYYNIDVTSLNSDKKDEILNWIYKIEPNERNVFYFPFVIKK